MASRKGEFGEPVVLDVDGFDVRVSSPERVYFPARGETKLDLARYYLAVGDGIVRALRERPCMLHRFPDGVAGDKVHQKRLPRGAPPWVETVRLHFPRYGLHADELCVTRLADVIWAVQMSTVEFHPWNSRRTDTEKPDEWRIDLDPMPDAPFSRVRRAAHVAHEVLDELGAVGWPKTSGGRGLHVYVRIRPDHGFSDVRRAALAFAREVERRLPDDVTTTWWRKDRDPEAVFVDYNQNARDHTIAAAYSVRGNAVGTVSTPISWDEVDDVEPDDFTIATVPERFARPRGPPRRHRRRRVRHRPVARVGGARRGRGGRGAAGARGRHRTSVMDLVVPPGPGLPHGLTIPGRDLVERFSRASGPGGQGVNTSDSRVELELDVASVPLTPTQRARVERALGDRMVDGRLVVVASEHRQQRRNRVAARERMADLLREALAPPPPPRRPTRPTRASGERRLAAKRRRSDTKAGRGRPAEDG